MSPGSPNPDYATMYFDRLEETIFEAKQVARDAKDRAEANSRILVRVTTILGIINAILLALLVAVLKGWIQSKGGSL